MAKNLDGIKKLNPEETKKYRKIVLNYLGEKDPAEAKREQIKFIETSARLLDGIKSNKVKSPPPDQPDRLKQAIKKQADDRRKVKEEDKRLERLRLEEKLKEKETARQARFEAEKKKRAAETKKWEEKIRLEEEEKETARLAKEATLIEKKKRRAEIKTVKLLKRAERNNRRRQAVKKFKENLSRQAKAIFGAVKKNYVPVLLFSLFFLLAAYAFVAAAVLRFRLGENEALKLIMNYLPVPAVITSQGMISYDALIKLKSRDYENLALADKKKYLLAWLLERDLRNKYGLAVDASSDDLASRYVLDKDFNLVGWSRINKILKLAASQNQLKELGKYADQYNDGAYYSGDEAAQKFGSAVFELESGQISRVIARPDGYYLVKKINDQENLLGLEYIFIGARTLDQHISGQSAQIKALILAD